MSLSATLFGTNSLVFKATNILGLGIPGLINREFGPGEPEAQRLGEISQQTAKEAEPRVIVWGRVRPIGGNLIHCQQPVKRMIKQSTSGGKGGSSKQKQKVEHVFRTYAVGVCEGPITGFSRIWRNSKLVYDARGTAWGITNNPVFLRNFRLYLGGWSQMPDPTLESIWGAGQVPAYRGTAYMVAIDEDLTDMGGAVPQWQFEVERAEGLVFTSRPYELESTESIRVSGGVSAANLRPVLKSGFGEGDDAGLGGNVSRLQLRATEFEYEHGEPEEIALGAGVTGLSLAKALAEYEHAEPEEVALAAGVTGLSLSKVLVEYTFPEPEAVEMSSGVTRINLNDPSN